MDWSKTVFRLRALPSTVETREDAARLLSTRLGDVPAQYISVYSLATTLKHWEDPPTKVATVMFDVPPSIVLGAPNKQEWDIPAKGHDRTTPDLILDTHFIGMTPLSDTSHQHNSYDCIAISGLASHPFGSWQPKGGDKRFMWIRDDLAKHAQGIRAIIYGYDTRLDSSSSFQNISDLAKHLIDQLYAYRPSASKTPMVFLAHSLGGLVVKQALRTLAEYPSDEEYKSLSDAVRGAIFFGVPNLGMEQREFQAIVQDKPNGILIRDLSQRSNFIHQLTHAFSSSPLHESCKFFWAYETVQSPTTVRKPDGRLSRDGPPAILVSPESATCGFVDSNPAVTFPINATHSGMVKFSQDSHYYSIVRAKLSQIIRSAVQTQNGKETPTTTEDLPTIVPDEVNESFDEANSRCPTGQRTERIRKHEPRSITADLDNFKIISSLTDNEECLFTDTTRSAVHNTAAEMQTEQGLRAKLMYLQQLKPFLVSIEQFGEVTQTMQLFRDHSRGMSYIWGPMKYILVGTSEFPQALYSILSAYQSIGEQIPQLNGTEPLFSSQPYLTDVLIMIFRDILTFHAEIIRHIKRRQWKELFGAWWKAFATTVDGITYRTARNKRLIENQVSFMDFETVRKDDLISALALEREKQAQEEHCRDTVRHWLSPFDLEAEHLCHREKRQICEDPGRWLLNTAEFKTWASHTDCLNPLLWLSGIPGAGKTVLASIVIDELSKAQGATVAYFYCKHGDEQRSSFESVARSILAQLLRQNPDLLSYFHEKANRSDNAVLTSVPLATEMLSTALRSCTRAFIVIDGVDECGRPARKQITRWFRHLVETLPATEIGSIRCLFVSQEDGMAVEDFHAIPGIKISNRNFSDIADFAGVWQQKIAANFNMKSHNMNLRSIISGRAKGMFIFAELFAKYLNDQLSIEALERQLLPDNLPVQLDNVYERILSRIREVRGPDAMKRIETILSWIVCARRPLRWEEIQNAVCIDVDNWTIENRRRLANSPTELFASLVECHADGTVDLVHGTARQYLIREGSVRLHQANFSLAIRCIAYLSFPYFDLERNDDEIRSAILDGVHQLYDYASACWAMHLQDGLVGLREDDLSQLRKALETLIDCRWSPTSNPISDIKRVRKTLSPLEASTKYDQIVQAVGWAKKQSSQYGIGPSPDEALNLWKVTEKVRSVLERIGSNADDAKPIKRLYGARRYKCPRVNCYYYHQGFRYFEQRNRHIKKHTRPYLCVVTGCPMEIFGYATDKDLQKHLFEAHYIKEFDDTEETAYPDRPEKKKQKSGNKEATFMCHDCDKTFTKQKSLNRHINDHSKEKRFGCDSCEKRFKRKEDCDRHKLTHSGKKYTCAGLLMDGTKWGCDTSFSRQDKLRDHFQTKKGLKCILPLVKEKQQSGGQGSGNLNVFANQTGANAEVLLNAGKSLPPFHAFLQFCGLSESVGAAQPRAASTQRKS